MAEVEKAIQEMEIIKQRLISHIETLEITEKSIYTRSNSSFHTWINEIAFQIGHLLGSVIGVPAEKLVRIISNFLE